VFKWFPRIINSFLTILSHKILQSFPASFFSRIRPNRHSFSLTISLRVVPSGHSESGADAVEERLPESANKSRVAVGNYIFGVSVVAEYMSEEKVGGGGGKDKVHHLT
jgi:hypothetical protein